MKKVIAMLLCAVLLLAALPGKAAATETALTRESAVIQDARRIYARCLATANKKTFAGFCGQMVSHQLWNMGINSWLESYDGNKQFDAYAAKTQTSGGYYITAYSEAQYSLEQALNEITRNGTEDAFNILVGFEWTSTEAGAIYGHACVINAILDGQVYFVESFDSAIGGKEGNVIVCSIPEFVDYFDDWTKFDGVIHFGKSYTDGCQNFGTDLFVRTRFASTLRSQPSMLGENDCVRLRSLASGERLRATSVYKNEQNELFYEILEGDRVGYVSANAVSVEQVNDKELALLDYALPDKVDEGAQALLEGVVYAENSSIEMVELTVIDQSGTTVQQAFADVGNSRFDLNELNEQLELQNLSAGTYTVMLRGRTACVVTRCGGLGVYNSTVLLKNKTLLVGEGEVRQEQACAADVPVWNGWNWDGTTWSHYRQGQRSTGWIQALGVNYYLKPEGIVATGWTEVEGTNRFFSDTGAMCTGWLSLEDGTYYLQEDGSVTVGLQRIDGRLYSFDEKGLLMNGGTVEFEGVNYQISPEGIASVMDVSEQEK